MSQLAALKTAEVRLREMYDKWQASLNVKWIHRQRAAAHDSMVRPLGLRKFTTPSDCGIPLVRMCMCMQCKQASISLQTLSFLLKKDNLSLISTHYYRQAFYTRVATGRIGQLFNIIGGGIKYSKLVLVEGILGEKEINHSLVSTHF